VKPVAGPPVAAPSLDRVSPWLRALVAQAVALAAVIAIAGSMAAVAGIHLGLAPLCVAHALLAAAIGMGLRLASWWIGIELAFGPSVVVASTAHLPSELFLVAFLVLAGLYWSTYRTQVPLYPSSPAVWDEVARLLPHGRAIRIVDVGSGVGGLVLHLASVRPESEVLGVELAPLPWLASVVRARLGRSTARFRRIDYESLDLGRFDVVFAFLSPAAMPDLWRKVRQEMAPGSLFLSLAFPVPDAVPDLSIAVPGLRGGTLCGWRLRPRVEAEPGSLKFAVPAS